MAKQIHWTGRSTNGIGKWKCDASTMNELYQTLVDKDVISTVDEDPYDNFVLDKYDKTIDDPEFQDDDGELDYSKVQDFVEKHPLSDNELWCLISKCNGNAYYQTFTVDYSKVQDFIRHSQENSDGELTELAENLFDEDGKLK